ncbi:glycosyltransferase family 61 protein [Leptolyngbya sp. FACHB-711]|uniref:glycosyltransferase family 61 protein n=1 Tax=Leptolyngbya sp. FACHB-711 TaxID=2692813 RepID=UPI00168898AE|nr:glycosyltransferase family 61 protein [Leptolyngbya sp. FACHB-711]MBD2023237.1 glycosyltransferase family 61 protein [Leptolyngbya sp. FACHB-711]
MQISLQHRIPGYVVDSALMFAYPTCAADVYTAFTETILLPEESVPEKNVQIQVNSKDTGARQTGSWKWKVHNKLNQALKGSETLDFSGRFVYDGRYDTEKNISHIIDNVATPVLLAKKALSEHLGQEAKIYVVLNASATELARQVYDGLGIPTICTDGNVFGEVVEVTPNRELYGFQPEAYDLEIKDYNPNTPERVFIPRKGSRQLSNNDEITEFLEKRGFVTYYFEDLTPSEEWSICRNAKVAVVAHGAGTANFVFNRRGLENPEVAGSGLRLIELFSPCFTLSRPGFRRLATLFNGRWCGVRGKMTPKVLRYLDFDKRPRNTLTFPIKDPYEIDLTTLLLALNHLKVY